MIFVDFRPTKNIFFLCNTDYYYKTESYVKKGGGGSSNHACWIFYSKSNCETMYHWFVLLEITVVKKMNNMNVCSSHSYLYPRCRFKWLRYYWREKETQGQHFRRFSIIYSNVFLILIYTGGQKKGYTFNFYLFILYINILIQYFAHIPTFSKDLNWLSIFYPTMKYVCVVLDI